MSKGTLYDKVFDLHTVAKLPTGQTQLLIGLHLIHEVTSPQAFDMINELGLVVAFPERSYATIDHIVPTDSVARPFFDQEAEEMISAWEKNVRNHTIPYFDFSSGNQGIVHVIGPELGLTQPGMTIACGDSHTSTHGAFGSLAFGIGTSQVRDVLASQTIAVDRLQVRKIDIDGTLPKGVYAKDVILEIIYRLGVNGGKGFAYEYGGRVVEHMSMEERMTLCNMSIEGGALIGYVNPDQTTFDYVKGRPFAPKDDAFQRAITYWSSIASNSDAVYNHQLQINGKFLKPRVTWGTNPGQSIAIDEVLPHPDDLSEPVAAQKAYTHMGFQPLTPLYGTKIDVAFIGSCTNGRISDLREAARIIEGRKIASDVKAIVVPGSQQVKYQAEQEGLDRIFSDAGFEWRGAGCSMCLGMNPDKLQGRELCASSSNRNFIGRQGSPDGRTLLMSPGMVAVAALEGKVVDVRDYV